MGDSAQKLSLWSWILKEILLTLGLAQGYTA
jgi:hypothetical protein